MMIVRLYLEKICLFSFLKCSIWPLVKWLNPVLCFYHPAGLAGTFSPHALWTYFTLAYLNIFPYCDDSALGSFLSLYEPLKSLRCFSKVRRCLMSSQRHVTYSFLFYFFFGGGDRFYLDYIKYQMQIEIMTTQVSNYIQSEFDSFYGKLLFVCG